MEVRTWTGTGRRREGKGSEGEGTEERKGKGRREREERGVEREDGRGLPLSEILNMPLPPTSRGTWRNLGGLEVGWEKVACWSTKASISLKRTNIVLKIIFLTKSEVDIVH